MVRFNLKGSPSSAIPHSRAPIWEMTLTEHPHHGRTTFQTIVAPTMSANPPAPICRHWLATTSERAVKVKGTASKVEMAPMPIVAPIPKSKRKMIPAIAVSAVVAARIAIAPELANPCMMPTAKGRSSAPS